MYPKRSINVSASDPVVATMVDFCQLTHVVLVAMVYICRHSLPGFRQIKKNYI